MALLTEARRLFLDMPFPAEAARCNESALSILVARGVPPLEIETHARRALALTRRHGLVLRERVLLSTLRGLGAPLLPG